MARYYFHLRDHTDEILDPEGLELPDRDAVRAAALRSARDILSHEMRTGEIDLRYRIDVEYADGSAVHSLPLADAFKIVGP